MLQACDCPTAALGFCIGAFNRKLSHAVRHLALDQRCRWPPSCPGLADTIGTQSEAAAVCDLSLSHVDIGRLIGDGLRAGLLIGLVLALPTRPMV